MSKIKQIAIVGFGRGLNTIVNFLFLPYLARALSIEDYGSYGQTLLIVTFLSALLSFGLPQIVYVFFNTHKKGQVISSSLLGAIVLAVVGVTIAQFTSGLLAHYFSNPALESLLSLYFFSLLFSLPFQVLNSYLVYSQLIKQSTGIAILSNIVKILLVLLAIQFYDSVYLAFLGIMVSQFLQLFFCMLYARKDFHFNFNYALVFKQLKNGFPLGLTGVLGSGILYSDGLMVSRMLGLESYAIYRIGALEVPFIATIYSSIAAIVLPEVARLFNLKKFDQIFNLKSKVIMNTIFITYPILVFLLFYASDIIIVYLGEKYAASTIIFSIFNLTLLIRINDYADILVAANRSRLIFSYYLITFFLNLLLNYILINLVGAPGAAISTVISIAFISFLQLRKSMHILDKNLLDLFNWKKLMHMLLLCFLVAFTIKTVIGLFTDHSLLNLLLGLIYFPLVYIYLFKRNFYSSQLTSASFKKSKLFKKWV